MSKFYVEERIIKNTRNGTVVSCDFSEETSKRILEGILYNCTAQVEMDQDEYFPVGNSTEVAFLKFLQDAEIPIHRLIKKKFGKIRAFSPHSSESKRSAVALECPEDPEKIVIYIKGAPEVVMDVCTHQLKHEGSEEMDSSDKQ